MREVVENFASSLVPGFVQSSLGLFVRLDSILCLSTRYIEMNENFALFYRSSTTSRTFFPETQKVTKEKEKATSTTFFVGFAKSTP